MPNLPARRTLARPLLLAALLAGFAAPASAAPGPASPRQAAGPDAPLVDLVEKFTRAQNEFDQAALAALTAPDYVELSPAGEVDPRDRMIGFYATKQPVPVMTLVEPQVRRFGDTAVVIARISRVMQAPGGPPREVSVRAGFVARHADGGWRLVSAQYTPIRAPHP